MTYKVLIVDDSKLARMAVIKTLSKTFPGWQRVEAASATEALKVMQRDQPDIALIDFNMPVQDGLHLAADLRVISAEMPVAIISANNQQEVVNRAQALGAAFLAKPLAESALVEFLHGAERALEATAS
jgi:YesN/AraC family two-component response regulator